MTDQLWASDAVQWSIWFAFMSLFMGGLARSRLRKGPNSTQIVLTYPRGIFFMGVYSTVLFLTLAALSLFYVNAPISSFAFWVFLGSASLGAGWIVAFSRVRHSLEPDGLRYQTLLAGRGFIRWVDIWRVSYSPVSKQFHLYGAAGEGVGISAMLVALPEFACAVLQVVPHEKIDENALGVLESTAAGRLPAISLWG